ncbi:unnamed protein product [marine sediment metagenome]|uniref:Uncharacterized protein n=1 Tax=marine sediment metagenome TaxID=412755 RepID=X1J1K4_9ZZZZ
MIKKCKRCEKERRIYAKGFCESCYIFQSDYYQSGKANKNAVKWKKNNPKRYKQSINEFKERNPTYWRDIMRVRTNVKNPYQK